MKIAMEGNGFHLTVLFVQDKNRRNFCLSAHHSYTMVLCAKSTIGISYNFCFVQHFSKIYKDPSTRYSDFRLFSPLLLSLNILLGQAKQQYVLLHKHNISMHRSSCLNNRGLLLSCFFLCLAQQVLEKKLLQPSALTANQYRLYIVAIPALVFFHFVYNHTTLFCTSDEYKESVGISISSYLSVSQNFTKKLAYSSILLN